MVTLAEAHHTTYAETMKAYGAIAMLKLFVVCWGLYEFRTIIPYTIPTGSTVHAAQTADRNRRDAAIITVVWNLSRG